MYDFELYSFDRYKGYRIAVVVFELEDGVFLYEGTAQQNGTTIYTYESVASGDVVRKKLMSMIDEDDGDE